MIEAFIFGAIGGCIAWCIWCVCDAGTGGWGGYHHSEKWAVNPRAMRWIIPVVVVGVYAYGFYLRYLGLI